jgi:hypothetical protein
LRHASPPFDDPAETWVQRAFARHGSSTHGKKIVVASARILGLAATYAVFELPRNTRYACLGVKGGSGSVRESSTPRSSGGPRKACSRARHRRKKSNEPGTSVDVVEQVLFPWGPQRLVPRARHVTFSEIDGGWQRAEREELPRSLESFQWIYRRFEQLSPVPLESVSMQDQWSAPGTVLAQRSAILAREAIGAPCAVVLRRAVHRPENSTAGKPRGARSSFQRRQHSSVRACEISGSDLCCGLAHRRLIYLLGLAGSLFRLRRASAREGERSHRRKPEAGLKRTPRFMNSDHPCLPFDEDQRAGAALTDLDRRGCNRDAGAAVTRTHNPAQQGIWKRRLQDRDTNIFSRRLNWLLIHRDRIG